MPVPEKLVWFVLVLGLIGFLDATYLTAEHYLEGPIPCSLVEGCEAVTTSEYSVLFGFPISLFGALYYLGVLVLAFFYIDLKNINFLRVILWLSALGFLTSLYLSYLQVFIIEALCLYCLISASVSTLLFVTSLLIFINLNRKPD